MFKLYWVVIAAFSFVMMSCNNGNTPDEAPPRDDYDQQGSIILWVGDAVGCVNRRPQYQWGGGDIMKLTITDTTGATTYWILTDNASGDAIASPVDQAVVPANAIEIDSTGDKDKKLPKEDYLMIKAERADGTWGTKKFFTKGGCE